MPFAALRAVLELDSSSFKSDIEEAQDSTSEFGDEIGNLDSRTTALAGGGIAALGGAITATVQSTQGMRAELATTAVTMGMTNDEAQELAKSISDASFPLEDATATLTALSEAGVDSEEDMEALASEFDELADATGTSANALVDELTPALRNLEGGIEDVSEVQDTLTYLQYETTLSVDEFSHSVEKLSPELAELGVNMDDTVAILAAMEENGHSGRAALQELRQATNETDGDMGDLVETLDVTEQQLQEQSAAIESSEGATQTYAEANNETITTMDRLRQRFEEVKLSAGGLLAPVEAAGPALMGLGGAAVFVSTTGLGSLITSAAGATAGILGGLVPASVAGTGGLSGLTAAAVGAQVALGPVTVPLWAILGAATAVVGALGGLAYAFHTNAYGIRDTVEDAFGTVQGWLDRIPNGLLALTGPIGMVYEAWRNDLFGVQDVVGDVFSWIGGRISWLRDQIERIPGIGESDLGEGVEADMGGGGEGMFGMEEAGLEEEYGDLGQASGESFVEGFSEGIVDDLEAEDAAEHLENEIDSLEGELSELQEGGMALEDQEEASELQSEIRELEGQLGDVQDAEGVEDVDPDILADAAQAQIDAEEERQNTLAQVAGQIDGADVQEVEGPDLSGEMLAESLPDNSGSGSATGDSRGSDKLTKEELTDAFLDALERVQFETKVDFNDREFNRIVDDRAETVVNDILT